MAQERQTELYRELDERTKHHLQQLQARLKLLEDHHRNCNLQAPEAAVQQSPPLSPTELNEELESEEFESDKEPPSLGIPSSNQALNIVHYEPTQKARHRTERPRWKNEADTMLKELPTAMRWDKHWESCGFQLLSSEPHASSSDITGIVLILRNGCRWTYWDRSASHPPAHQLPQYSRESLCARRKICQGGQIFRSCGKTFCSKSGLSRTHFRVFLRSTPGQWRAGKED
jgi:hypothetical protein